MELLRKRNDVRVIVINTSYKLAPWADVLYACDAKWWRIHRGVPEFKGMKVTQDKNACTEFNGLHLVKVEKFVDELLLNPYGTLGAGGNSGFQAINLAVQFGISRILLIGYDMNDGNHWHKRHPAPLSNPHPISNLPRWRRAIDGMAPKLAELGIEVVNCNHGSALRAYRRMTLPEAIEYQ